MPAIDSATFPLLVSVTECNWLQLPTVVEPNERLVAERDAVGDCAVMVLAGLAVILSVDDSASVAVRVSAVVALLIERLLKVADPPDKAADVVPPSRLALSDITTALVAAAATEPLSVSATTGLGVRGTPAAWVEAGLVLKLSA